MSESILKESNERHIKELFSLLLATTPPPPPSTSFSTQLNNQLIKGENNNNNLLIDLENENFSDLNPFAKKNSSNNSFITSSHSDEDQNKNENQNKNQNLGQHLESQIKDKQDRFVSSSPAVSTTTTTVSKRFNSFFRSF